MVSRTPCASSIGRVFHSLQATSQALQPMHTEVSVKKPTRFGWSASYPASPATSGSGPYSRFRVSAPARPGLAELTVMPASRRACASRSGRPLARLGRDRVPAVAPHPARRHTGPPAVGLHELDQLRSPRAAARDDVAGADLVLLDVGVR